MPTANYVTQNQSLGQSETLQQSVSPAASPQQTMKHLNYAQPGEAAGNGVLPGNIKQGIESLSGFSMDSVRVHYNSSKPANLQADAYAQGSNIYLGPGQERHLAHEAWHVVQQSQGRVNQTMQFAGLPVNNSNHLETEADLMGDKALRLGDKLTAQDSPHIINSVPASYHGSASSSDTLPIQRKLRSCNLPNISIAQCSFKTEYQTNYADAAERYEKDLGLYTYGLNRSEQAVDQALGNIKQIMGVADDQSYADHFGSEDARSAGAVGTIANTVRTAVNNGNLREKMTAFYNASLGPFKKVIEDAWAADDVAAAVGGLTVPDEGKANILARKAQIDTMTGDFRYRALPLKHQIALRDVYMAPKDFWYRDSKTDDLYRGQKGVTEPEARMRKIDSDNSDGLNALRIIGLNDVAFANNLFDGMGPKRFYGAFLHTSIFADISRELTAFNAGGGDQATKLTQYRKLQKSVWKWLKNNPLEGTNEQQQVYNGQLAGNGTQAEKIAGVADVLKKHMAITLLNSELDKVHSVSLRSPDALDNGLHSAPLSDREKNHIKGKLADYDSGGVYDMTKKLPWVEGGSYYSATVKNAWAKEAVEVLKMPVRSGPSGTTDRMLQAVQYLGLDSLPYKEDFRLALLGWMLTANDHSFHEIMGVSKTYGLPYDPGLDAYNHIAPLDEQQLRINACRFPNFMHIFPDEVAYYKTIQDDASQLLSPSKDRWSDKASVNPLALNERGLGANADYEEKGLPFLNRSVTAYTAIPVSFINLFLKRPNTARAEMAWHLKFSAGNEWIKKQARKTKDAFPEAGGNSLMEEMPYHTQFLNRAWQQLPVFNGVSWRGGGAPKLYSDNDEFSIDEYWSSTKLANPTQKVQWYAEKAGGAVKLIFRITGSTGRVVNGVSINEKDDVRNRNVAPRTDEVLFQPGTRFRVTAVSPIGGVNAVYPVVDVTEL